MLHEITHTFSKRPAVLIDHNDQIHVISNLKHTSDRHDIQGCIQVSGLSQ